MSSYEKPIQDLFDELDKTGVISDNFKSLIKSHVMHIAKDAYDRGKEAGKNA